MGRGNCNVYKYIIEGSNSSCFNNDCNCNSDCGCYDNGVCDESCDCNSYYINPILNPIINPVQCSVLPPSTGTLVLQVGGANAVLNNGAIILQNTNMVNSNYASYNAATGAITLLQTGSYTIYFILQVSGAVSPCQGANVTINFLQVQGSVITSSSAAIYSNQGTSMYINQSFNGTAGASYVLTALFNYISAISARGTVQIYANF